MALSVKRIEYFQVHQRMRPGTVYGADSRYQEPPWDVVPKFLFLLHTDGGVTGMGETPRGVKEEAVSAAARGLVGQDLLSLDLHELPIPRNAVYKGLEIAVFDAVGKASGKRAVDLLGGPVRDRVEVDYWSGRCSPEELAGRAKRGRSLGYRGMKIKCKLEDPMVERMRAVKDAVPDMPITVDPNSRFYQRDSAAALARDLAPIGNVHVFEDPIVKDDFDEYTRLRQDMQGTGILLALHLGSIADVKRAIDGGCVDALNCSPLSFVTFVEMAALAHRAGLPVWHGSGADCGILDLSYLHACAAAPAVTLPSDLCHRLHEEHFLVQPPHIEQGFAVLPDAPGLGGELDMAAVERQLISRGVVE